MGYANDASLAESPSEPFVYGDIRKTHDTAPTPMPTIKTVDQGGLIAPIAFPDYEDEAGEDEWDSPQIEGVSKTWKAVNVTDVVIREVGNVPCRVDGLTERQQIPGQNMVRPPLLILNDQPGDRRAADQKVQHKPRFPLGDSEDRRRQNRGQ